MSTEFAHKSKYNADDWPAGYDRYQALMNKLDGYTTKVESHSNKIDDDNDHQDYRPNAIRRVSISSLVAISR